MPRPPELPRKPGPEPFGPAAVVLGRPFQPAPRKSTALGPEVPSPSNALRAGGLLSLLAPSLHFLVCKGRDNSTATQDYGGGGGHESESFGGRPAGGGCGQPAPPSCLRGWRIRPCGPLPARSREASATPLAHPPDERSALALRLRPLLLTAAPRGPALALAFLAVLLAVCALTLHLFVSDPHLAGCSLFST